MNTRIASRKRWLSLATAVAAAGSVVSMGTAALFAAGGSAPAAAPAAAGSYWGYSTGTVVHTGVLQGGLNGPRLGNVDEAFSGATVSNRGIGAMPPVGPSAVAGQIVNEMSREVQRVLPAGMPARSTFARGAGLEVGLAEALPAGLPQIPINSVQSLGPARFDLTRQIGPVTINPLVSAAALKGQGTTDWNDDACVIGKPISQGLGNAVDVRLVGLGAPALPGGPSLLATAASGPQRGVAQSRSQTALMRQSDAAGKVLGSKLALGTETRQTIAPVTLFKGTPAEITIEVLGEWVLRAVAGGVPGSAYVRYAPGGSPTPTTPILRIVQRGLLQPVTKIVNFQDLFGSGKLLPIPLVNIPGIAKITVGESARALGSDGSANPAGPHVAPDGTSASAAVDVVRVQLLERRDLLGRLLSGVGDVRIGHMEARAEAPKGGIDCGIPVAKTVSPSVARPGETLNYKVNISNPFDCTLNPVKVVDEVAPSGVRTSLVNALGGQKSGNTITWSNVGPIAPHASKTVPVSMLIAPDSPAGVVSNHVNVNATCTSGGEADGMSNVVVPVDGAAGVDSKVVSVQAAPGGAQVLASTETNTGVDGLAATGISAWLHTVGTAMALVGAFGLLGLRKLSRTTS
jgi:uncharacterized repeat protein (TIGR01451 family)